MTGHPRGRPSRPEPAPTCQHPHPDLMSPKNNINHNKDFRFIVVAFSGNVVAIL